MLLTLNRKILAFSTSKFNAHLPPRSTANTGANALILALQRRSAHGKQRPVTARGNHATQRRTPLVEMKVNDDVEARLQAATKAVCRVGPKKFRPPRLAIHTAHDQRPSLTEAKVPPPPRASARPSSQKWSAIDNHGTQAETKANNTSSPAGNNTAGFEGDNTAATAGNNASTPSSAGNNTATFGSESDGQASRTQNSRRAARIPGIGFPYGIPWHLLVPPNRLHPFAQNNEHSHASFDTRTGRSTGAQPPWALTHSTQIIGRNLSTQNS